jgi:hypothetical protein
MSDDTDQPGRSAATAGSELDDALYYLRHDCEPCAERHFALARRLGATDEMIARIRDLASSPDSVT